MTVQEVVKDLLKQALGEDDDEVSDALYNRAMQLDHLSMSGTMRRLLDALATYEAGEEPGTLPRVVLFSDGSGTIETSTAGVITDFTTPDEAIKWLRGAG